MWWKALITLMLLTTTVHARMVDIRANGRKNFTKTSPSMKINIEISQNGTMDNKRGDYWIIAVTPNGIYYDDMNLGWMRGIQPSYQGNLLDFPLTSVSAEIVSSWSSSTGNFTFYFGTDGNPNGEVDMDSLVYDSVTVEVSNDASSGVNSVFHPNYITKRFILFAHGMADIPEHWDKFASFASTRGYNVLRTQVSRCGSIESRAEQLAAYILRVTDEGDRFKAVGHSMGGLDLRYLVGSADYPTDNHTREDWLPAAKRISKVYTLATPHGGSFTSDHIPIDTACDHYSEARKDCGDEHMAEFNNHFTYDRFTVDGVQQDFMAFTFQCWCCGGNNDCVVGTNAQHWDGAPQWYTTLSGKHSYDLIDGWGSCCTTEQDNVNEVLIPILSDAAFGRAEINTTSQFSIVHQASNKCMNVRGAKGDDGTIIEIWDCAEIPQQYFKFIPVGPYYQIKSMVSGKCLDVTGASKANGAVIQQWTCNRVKNQLFKAEEISKGVYRFVAAHSGKCIDLSYGNTNNGNYFHQWDCGDGNPSQMFILRESPTRFVRFKSKRTGKFMDAGSGSTVYEWSEYPTLNQWFIAAEMREEPDEKNSPVYYRIISVGKGKCFNVESGSEENGADIQLFECLNVEQEKFEIVPKSDGYVQIRSKKTGKCLDLKGGRSEDGTNIQQWECIEGEPNQLWKPISYF